MDKYDGFLVDIAADPSGHYRLVDEYILFHPSWVFIIGTCKHEKQSHCFRHHCELYDNSHTYCFEEEHEKCPGKLGKNGAGLYKPCLCACHRKNDFIIFDKICTCDARLLLHYGHQKGCDYA